MGTRSFIVASDDHMIRVAAESAGAMTMSSQRIVDELKAVRKTALYRAEAVMARINGQTIRHDSYLGTSEGRVGFGRGQLEIVDKRKGTNNNNNNKTTGKKNQVVGSSNAATLQDMKEGTKEIPTWAMTPNITKPTI